MADSDSLAEQTGQTREGFLARLAPDARATIRDQLQQRRGAGAGAIAVGDTAPDFELRNVHGYRVSLAERLHAGPVVLSFFRGAWCSFCNLELRALQRRLPQIEALGATLLALSPEAAEHSARVAERHQLGYDILVDAGNQAARAYGLIDAADPELADFDERAGVDLGEWNADGDSALPTPATFVLAGNGTVVAAHVLGDWTQRMEPDAIIAVLRSL